MEVLEAVGIAIPAGLLIPDVVVARAAAVHSAPRELQACDVLAVVEVVSPSSRRTDRLGKPLAYAEVAHPRPGERSRLDRPFPVLLDPARLSSPLRP